MCVVGWNVNVRWNRPQISCYTNKTYEESARERGALQEWTSKKEANASTKATCGKRTRNCHFILFKWQYYIKCRGAPYTNQPSSSYTYSKYTHTYSHTPSMQNGNHNESTLKNCRSTKTSYAKWLKQGIKIYTLYGLCSVCCIVTIVYCCIDSCNCNAKTRRWSTKAARRKRNDKHTINRTRQ